LNTEKRLQPVQRRGNLQKALTGLEYDNIFPSHQLIAALVYQLLTGSCSVISQSLNGQTVKPITNLVSEVAASTRLFSARLVRRAALAVALVLIPIASAEAGAFTCISGAPIDCALADSTLSWSWNGVDFIIANNGGGYVSEVYFDLGAGMAVSFSGGTGTVLFTPGASPGSLPGGMSVGFQSDVGFDSDSPGSTHNGIDNGETATFHITGVALDSLDIGTLAGGIHVRSLVDNGASLVTSSAQSVPEPATLVLLGVGPAGVRLARRRTLH
jgi:hypothetical protein